MLNQVPAQQYQSRTIPWGAPVTILIAGIAISLILLISGLQSWLRITLPLCVSWAIISTFSYDGWKKGFVFLFFPISVLILQFFGMGTNVNIGIAFIVIGSCALLMFDTTRKIAEQILYAFGFFGGGIIIFLAAAFLFAELAKNGIIIPQSQIIVTIFLIGWLAFVMSQKRPAKWFAIALQILFFMIAFSAPTAFGELESPIVVAIENQQLAWSQMFEGFGKAAEKFGQEATAQYRFAMGDYAPSIEENSKKPLGVFLENVKTTAPFVSLEDSIDVYGRLRAESFQTEKPLNINMNCYDEQTKKTGRIIPNSKFDVEEYELMDVDCLFEASALGAGQHNIVMEALFSFPTSAYLKTYFMPQDRIRAYRRENPDPQANPLDAYKIVDKNPISVFTAGPLRVGISVPSQPIALVVSNDEESKRGPSLTITVDKNWFDGELKKISKIEIAIPPGLGIEFIENVKPTCIGVATAERKCAVPEQVIKKIFQEPIVLPRTMRVQTVYDDYAALMQGAPLAIRSVKVDVEYEYQIKRQVQVTVREPIV